MSEYKKNQLEQLKEFTKVVADTGDFEAMKEFKPQDATTNPSLILAAAGKETYAHLVDQAAREFKSGGTSTSNLGKVIDRILVLFGLEILKIVPGRVSTEVDARLSFNRAGTLEKARELIGFYEKEGIDRERVLIKIASTWEGIKAAEELEKEGIHCNLTLLFSFPQAVACADAKVQLISPFVGRIYDYFKKHDGQEFAGMEDPGVKSVHQIYNYYKKFGHRTEVMGASFRNKGQITSLAGCDLLTISPDLLGELHACDEPLKRALSSETAKEMELEPVKFNEAEFRFAFNEDAMAVEKTSEGIRKFAADVVKLEALVAGKLG